MSVCVRASDFPGCPSACLLSQEAGDILREMKKLLEGRASQLKSGRERLKFGAAREETLRAITGLSAADFVRQFTTSGQEAAKQTAALKGRDQGSE